MLPGLDVGPHQVGDGLRPELLGAYRSAFPASPVTSVCAVPVEGLSAYEKEVLLRGPFFQILGMTEDSAAGPAAYLLHTGNALSRRRLLSRTLHQMTGIAGPAARG